MNDMCEINANTKSNDLTLQEQIAMLNADQKRILDKVAHHLLHQKEHEEEKCKCDIKPLQMFISGVGGTGKSFLIEAVKAFVDDQWPSDDCKCAITAPTGLATFNVGGVTTHTEMTRLSQPWHKVATMLFYNLGTTLAQPCILKLSQGCDKVV